MSEGVPGWAWAGFAALVAVMLSIDLLGQRGEQPHARKRAIVWSVVWIGAALAFNVAVAWLFGRQAGEEFLGAYLLEKSLSVDNLFVFLVIFQSFGVPQPYQRRVLIWGIVGALVTRGIFIAVGAAAIARWHALVYVFGALLLVTGLKLLARPAPVDPSKGRIVRFLRRHLPFTGEIAGPEFVVREGGRLLATPLLLALVTVELTDVMFAVDSVPAAFAVTERPFIIYTSNVFAVLGLRSLYVVLADSLTKIRFLHQGLAAILMLAGVKMIASHWIEVPPLISVGAIALCVLGAVLASLFIPRRPERRAPSSRQAPLPPYA